MRSKFDLPVGSSRRLERFFSDSKSRGWQYAMAPQDSFKSRSLYCFILSDFVDIVTILLEQNLFQLGEVVICQHGGVLLGSNYGPVFADFLPYRKILNARDHNEGRVCKIISSTVV